MLPREKSSLTADKFISEVVSILDDIQNNLFNRALNFRNENIVLIDDYLEFVEYFTPKNKEQPEIHGGFAHSHWCGDAACEEKAKNELKISIRCIPLDSVKEKGKCIICGNPSKERVLFAKGY
jgi:prolyl-tRNA synthetase